MWKVLHIFITVKNSLRFFSSPSVLSYLLHRYLSLVLGVPEKGTNLLFSMCELALSSISAVASLSVRLAQLSFVSVCSVTRNSGVSRVAHASRGASK